MIAFVEQLIGGEAVKVRRQARWRPAWFVDIDRDGTLVRLHVRGDRGSDVLPFPSLQREADILKVLEDGGIAVPHVFGMCADPPAIVMDAVVGKRDITGLPASQQQVIADQYIAMLAKMHQLDTAPFGEIGLTIPQTATEIALGMLDAYVPLYERTKVNPEPMIEFAIAWARRNVPMHRTRASFVHWDAGQFLQDGEKVTALHDFETCLVGDPLMDLAALRLRDPAEPLGADLAHIFRRYEEESGEPIDRAALGFHTMIFGLVGAMALAGPMVNPQPGSPHFEYLWWDLMQRRAAIWALAECLGVTIDPPLAPEPAPTTAAPMLHMLADLLAQLQPASGVDRYPRHALGMMAKCLIHNDGVGAQLDRQTTDEFGAILGRYYDTRLAADHDLEQFVRTAGPEWDVALVQCFARQIERQVLALAPIADYVAGYALAPIP
jgi:aminoglycoside phosphotransferase (APT) family kinase protein